MNMPNKLNLKQPKYILPAILYFPLLGLGYLFIDIFHTEIAEEVNTELQTTEYLNAELPSANVKEGLGGKRENVEKTFGNIRDLSAMENIDNDLDSVKKKEDFSSNYTEKDLEELAKNARSQGERELYNDMRRKLQEQAGTARDQSGADFVKDISDEERAKIDELRRNNHLDDVIIKEWFSAAKTDFRDILFFDDIDKSFQLIKRHQLRRCIFCLPFIMAEWAFVVTCICN